MFYLSIHLNTDIPQNFHNIIFNDRLNLTMFYILLLHTSCIRPDGLVIIIIIITNFFLFHFHYYYLFIIIALFKVGVQI